MAAILDVWQGHWTQFWKRTNEKVSHQRLLSQFKFFFLLILFSCLHMISDIQDIPEAYIHLIHTKQYYTFQYELVILLLTGPFIEFDCLRYRCSSEMGFLYLEI
jgi:succinate dehydrogenase hydrophobic anchor subunit